jgi:hypothetical protein
VFVLLALACWIVGRVNRRLRSRSH